VIVEINDRHVLCILEVQMPRCLVLKQEVIMNKRRRCWSIAFRYHVSKEKKCKHKGQMGAFQIVVAVY